MAPVAVSPLLPTIQMASPIPNKLRTTNGTIDIPPVPPSPSSSARPQEVLNAPPRTQFSFDSMEDALAGFGRGEFLVVADDEDRENEGDLIIAASEVSTEKMAWMIKHTRYDLAS